MEQLILRLFVLPIETGRIDQEAKWPMPQTTGNLCKLSEDPCTHSNSASSRHDELAGLGRNSC